MKKIDHVMKTYIRIRTEWQNEYQKAEIYIKDEDI